jgi:uncharacterized protein (DUF1778 family)
LSLVATPMADTADPGPPCTYVSMKVDDQVLPLVKAAAALAGQSVQDYASDILNQAASQALGRKPVKRRTPKDK